MADFIKGPLGFGRRRKNREDEHSTPRKRPKISSRTVEFCMITDRRFSIHGNCLNDQDLENVFESMPTGSYNPDTENWEFSIVDRYELVMRLQQLNNLNFIDCPINILSKILQPICPIDESCLELINPKIVEMLEPFEREGVCAGISRMGRIMIADEMGLNKKVQALAIMDRYRFTWPLLICTSKRSKDIWAEYIIDFYPNFDSDDLLIVDSTKDEMGDAKVIICSHALMSKISQRFVKMDIQCIIFDESHCFKNYKSARTENALMLAKCANRVILLSGAPALARPVELFTQLRMIENMFLEFKSYADRYCKAVQTDNGLYTRGAENLEELKLLLRHYIVRRTKEEIMSSSRITRKILRLCPAEYDEEYRDRLQEYRHAGSSHETLMKRFHCYTAEIKKTVVCSYLSQNQNDLVKTVIYAIHKVMLDAIHDFLSKNGIMFVRIDGNTTENECRKRIRHFQDVDHYKVALLSMGTVGENIDLSVAQSIIFAEIDWSPCKMIDSESRVHRFGNERPVSVTYLLQEKTTDDIIWKIIQKKENVLTKAGIYNQKLVTDSLEFEEWDYVFSDSEPDSNDDDDSNFDSYSDSDQDFKEDKHESTSVDTETRISTPESPSDSGLNKDEEIIETPVRKSRRLRKRNGSDVSDSDKEDENKVYENDDPADSQETFPNMRKRKTKVKRNILEDNNTQEISHPKKFSNIIDTPSGSESEFDDKVQNTLAEDSPLYVPPGFQSSPLASPSSSSSNRLKRFQVTASTNHSDDEVSDNEALRCNDSNLTYSFSSSSTSHDSESLRKNKRPQKRFKRIISKESFKNEDAKSDYESSDECKSDASAEDNCSDMSPSTYFQYCATESFRNQESQKTRFYRPLSEVSSSDEDQINEQPHEGVQVKEESSIEILNTDASDNESECCQVTTKNKNKKKYNINYDEILNDGQDYIFSNL